MKPSKDPIVGLDDGFFWPNEAINSYFPSRKDEFTRGVSTLGSKGGFIIGCMSYETAAQTHHTAFCFTHEGNTIYRCQGSESGYFGNYAD